MISIAAEEACDGTGDADWPAACACSRETGRWERLAGIGVETLVSGIGVEAFGC
jgi:hypothetical protein